MSLIKTISDGANSYFHGFEELSHCCTNDAKTNVKAGLKVASFIFVLPPIVMGIAWLIGRITNNPNNDAVGRTNQAVKDILLPKKAKEIVPPKTDEEIVTANNVIVADIKSYLEKVPSIKDLDSNLSMASQNEYNPPMTEIITGQLYLGKGSDAKNAELLNTKNICHVFSFSQEIPEDERDESVNYYPLIVESEADFSSKMNAAITKFNEIRKNNPNEGILIHCDKSGNFRGRGERSGAVVIAILMKMGLSLDEASRYVKSKRLIVDVAPFKKDLLPIHVSDAANLIAIAKV